MEKDLYEIIKANSDKKIFNSENLPENIANCLIEDFASIEVNKCDEITIFRHPIYAYRDFTALNAEEVNELLMLEENQVMVDFNEEMFNFSKFSKEMTIAELNLMEGEIAEPEEQGDLSQEVVV